MNEDKELIEEQNQIDNKYIKKISLLNEDVFSWVYDFVKNNKNSDIKEIVNDKIVLKDKSNEINNLNSILEKIKS